MSTEKLPSIHCENCGGWHPSETHAQYEKDAREKRMAEIKNRPDSAYIFNTLGFTQERGGKIEPWMHTVIEKAKELGDDLQDSDFYLHTGPLEDIKGGGWKTISLRDSKSVLSFLNQPSLQESLASDRISPEIVWVSPHNAGKELRNFWTGKEMLGRIRSLLDIQERFVKTRREDDLIAYQKAIEDELNKIIEDLNFFFQNTNEPGREKFKEEAIDLLQKLDTTEGRKKAVKLILRRYVGSGYHSESVGVVFKISEELREKFECRIMDGEGNFYSKRTDAPQEFIAGVSGFGRESDWSIVASSKIKDLDSARSFYRMFIHALYLQDGSIEEQKKVLARMLEKTKDSPEQRLPIYNFYGKLVWPRPPEEKKRQE